MSRISFTLGEAAGWLTAPAFAFASFLRSARALHPRGVTLRAVVRPHPAVPASHGALAERLSGDALVPFSAAIWKRAEGLPDVLGCALRLPPRGSDDNAEGDQDLLFATIRRPWTMPFAPFTTKVRDYLGNDYFAVSPFRITECDARYLRVHPEVASSGPVDARAARLLHDVADGRGVLNLEAAGGPYGPWVPVAVLTLRKVADVDDEALRFSPFHTGRGITPTGFVHGMRVGAYALSQRARPTRSKIGRPA